LYMAARMYCLKEEFDWLFDVLIDYRGESYWSSQISAR
jgi:hypothetical protein